MSVGSEPKYVYVVEDDAAVRESLVLLLHLRGYEPIAIDRAEAFPPQEAVARPACALLDVRLPGMSGLDLQRKLKTENSTLPVIVMTAHGDIATARSALRDGAIDFLEKPLDEDDLLQAVDLALRADLEHVERAQQFEGVLERLQRLTEREMGVFNRITDGAHNREIAEELGISPRTVEVHRARLMEKLGARRVADLFRIRFEINGHGRKRG